jgi:hypothetical protein
MPNSRTYTGGCHCGQVRFECTTDMAMVTACNCSICTKKGLHFTFVAPKSFVLRAGEENLKEYLFKQARHPALALPRLRRRRIRARQQARRQRSRGAERQLHRWSRACKACDDADRWAESVVVETHYVGSGSAAPSPRSSRGRDERSSFLEGWGEGLSRHTRTRGESPHPDFRCA